MATQQVETGTVVGTITGTGNAAVTVTASGMGNSPKTINVAVTNGDTASTVGGLVRTALAFDSDVAAMFLVSGSGANIVLTKHVASANDSMLNIAIDNGTCTGLTAAPTSTNTTAGDGLSNPYCTLAEYKAWISMRGQSGAVVTDTSDDGVLEILIQNANQYFYQETGRRFYKDTIDATRYYTADDPYSIKIDPLSAAPTSVSVDYTEGQRSYTALTNTQYDLMPANAALDGMPYTRIEINPVLAGYFPLSTLGVQVIGKFGFPSVPTDVKTAVMEIVQNVNSLRSGQSAAGRVTITAAGIVIRPEEVPAYAQRVIQHYRPRT